MKKIILSLIVLTFVLQGCADKVPDTRPDHDDKEHVKQSPLNDNWILIYEGEVAGAKKHTKSKDNSYYDMLEHNSDDRPSVSLKDHAHWAGISFSDNRVIEAKIIYNWYKVKNGIKGKLYSCVMPRFSGDLFWVPDDEYEEYNRPLTSLQQRMVESIGWNDATINLPREKEKTVLVKNGEGEYFTAYCTEDGRWKYEHNRSFLMGGDSIERVVVWKNIENCPAEKIVKK